MKARAVIPILLVAISFATGFFTHALYRAWTDPTTESRSHPVRYAPLSPSAEAPAAIPVVLARDMEKLRSLAGHQARVQGRIYRVGYSAKSNTHFLNFGPSRAAFTGVIFASALEAFAKNKIQPKGYEGREVEISGEIKDHPQFGLEMILEHPSQIKVLD